MNFECTTYHLDESTVGGCIVWHSSLKRKTKPRHVGICEAMRVACFLSSAHTFIMKAKCNTITLKTAHRHLATAVPFRNIVNTRGIKKPLFQHVRIEGLPELRWWPRVDALARRMDTLLCAALVKREQVWLRSQLASSVPSMSWICETSIVHASVPHIFDPDPW